MIQNTFSIKTFFIVVLAFIVFVNDSLFNLLIFTRESIIDGEFWRIITGNLVHFSIYHISFNLLAFGATGWIIEQKGYPGYLSLILFSAISIGLSVFIFQPKIELYGGLSGIVHATMVYVALFGLKEKGVWRQISISFLVLVFLKLGQELVTNSALVYNDTTYVIVPLSHLTGVIVAIVQFSFLQYMRNKQKEITVDI